jgi:hypothetical protein
MREYRGPVIERPKLPLTLSGLEVVFLTDGIRNSDIAEGLPDKDAYWPLAREALLLLGSAYLEVVTPEGIKPGPVTIYISEEVAWLLRGKVRTGDVAIDGKTNVGTSLLLKLYAMLESFNSGLLDLETVAIEEPPVDNTKLEEFRQRELENLQKEVTDARTDTNPDKGS